ncbi:MAG: hypothetical protein SFU84_06245 [Gemmatimonadales bacterium]|nr:hypothetical protein [Gemmatimonadales bacterium]
MIIRDRSFPHPVLAPFLDDVSPNEFECRVLVSADADQYYLSVAFSYTNESLQTLVTAGLAVHSIHVECKRNYFRHLYTLSDRAGVLSIRTSEIIGRVEISGFISAAVPIPDYSIAGAHSDYGDTAFNIEIGDILAAASTVTFDAYTDYDPLSTIASILMVRCSEAEVDGPLKLDTSGDLLNVTLSQSDYARYVELKGDPSLGALLANQIVVPVLVEAVHEIKATPAEEIELEMQKRWYRSIVRKFEVLDLDVMGGDTPAVELTQILLQLPLRRSLEGLIQITEMDGDV